MSKENTPVRAKKKSNSTAVWCRLLGTLILLVVILAVLAVSVPRYQGYGMCNVVNNTMEPQIPTGSAAYILPTEGSEISAGEIIAFDNEVGMVLVQRVVSNNIQDKIITAKGDTDQDESISEVSYDRLQGVIVYHLPVLGHILMIVSTGIGKLFLTCFAACGFLLVIMGGRLEP